MCIIHINKREIALTLLTRTYQEFTAKAKAAFLNEIKVFFQLNTVAAGHMADHFEFARKYPSQYAAITSDNWKDIQLGRHILCIKQKNYPESCDCALYNLYDSKPNIDNSNSNAVNDMEYCSAIQNSLLNNDFNNNGFRNNNNYLSPTPNVCYKHFDSIMHLFIYFLNNYNRRVVYNLFLHEYLNYQILIH